MSKQELKIYELATSVIYGKLTIDEFALLISKSYRQAQRIVKKVKNKGGNGVKHGNTNRVPANKTSWELEMDILGLLKGKYYDFNLTHFREMILEHEGIRIGRNIVHRIATKYSLVKRPKRRSKVKLHKPRPRLPQEGMLVQFDGSPHVWFGNIYCDLIGGIDDATGEVVGAEFFIGETSLNCMKVMKDIILRKGVPAAFYLDQAGYFGKDDRDQAHTQIGRALQELNCNVILAGSPQAKGKIEKLWNTFQDRLVAELRLFEIKSILQANDYLQNTFISKYNKQFSIVPRIKDSAYRELEVKLDLEQIFCIKEKRKISSSNSFSWKGEKYIVDECRDYRYRTININTHYDGHCSFDILGKIVSIKECARAEHQLCLVPSSIEEVRTAPSPVVLWPVPAGS
ncbi:MAG: ISNCY family transposase [Oligoflexia bacterium]|nr:ISNCY family transposase [Oligoflexia bacterium]